jgi:hypothetical protein
MFNPVGLVTITLGSVVLDRPDQTGRYIAKDLAGGWAYLIGDADGDNRCRGQGVCEGGLDLTLRCAFLSAGSRVPDCAQIRILVETRQAHRMMVQLAVKDPHVIAAIAGRPVSVMTRPDARSSFQVRTAAERAASAALRDREYAEWHEPPAEDPARPAADGLGVVTGLKETIIAVIGKPKPGATPDWRAHLTGRRPHLPTGPGTVDSLAREAAAVASPRSAAIGWFVSPLLRSARNGLTAAGVLAPRHVPRSRAVKAWLQELDSHVATIRGDLQDVGA